MITKDCYDNVIKLFEQQGYAVKVAEFYSALSDEAAENDLPSVTVVLPFYDESSKLKKGDYAPELHFVLRRVEDVETGTDAGVSEGGEQADEESPGSV